MSDRARAWSGSDGAASPSERSGPCVGSAASCASPSCLMNIRGLGLALRCPHGARDGSMGGRVVLERFAREASRDAVAAACQESLCRRRPKTRAPACRRAPTGDNAAREAVSAISGAVGGAGRDAVIAPGLIRGACSCKPWAEFREWQEWRGSNPQPPVLETGALPVELHSCSAFARAFNAATAPPTQGA